MFMRKTTSDLHTTSIKKKLDEKPVFRSIEKKLDSSI